MNADRYTEARLEALTLLASNAAARETFFPTAVRALAIGMRARFACVGRLDDDGDTVHVIAAIDDGVILDPFSYSAKTGPCDRVYRSPADDPLCMIQRGVADLYPACTLLSERRAENYWGEAFRDADGRILGHVFAFDTAARKGEFETTAFFRLVSQRIGAEFNRYLAEKSLHDNQERFKNIAQSASDWFWEMDENLRYTYFSSRVEEAAGLPPEYYVGKTRTNLAAEGTRSAKWKRHLTDLEARKSFKDFRYVVKASGGRELHLSVSGRPVFDDNGTFRGYVGVGHDLTAQIRAEETRGRLLAAVEALDEGFALFDKDDRLVVYNEKFRAQAPGLSELLKPGVPFRDLIVTGLEIGLFPDAEEDPEAFIEERMARRRDPREAWELRRWDGTWLSVHEQRLPGGDIVTLTTDVTRLKNAEQALLKSEARLKDFAETAADWFWEQDAELRFTYISDAYEAITGFSPAERYGKTRRETRIRGVSETALAAHERLLAAHRPFADFRFSRCRPDGTRIHIATSGKPVFADDGVFASYRGVGRDITDLVAAEDAVRAERDKAEEASRAKSEFLANMSHDLRTPLNAILGFSQIIRDETIGPVGNDAYAEYAGNIFDSGEILLDLINDLLDLSKIEAGKLELVDDELQLAPLFTELRNLFEEQAAARKIAIRHVVSPPELSLRADMRAVRQMLMNLISNALKYSPDPSLITVRAEREADAVVLSVRDQGVGIDEAEQEKALAPFGRTQHAISGSLPGTGLGLPIVKSLVEAHGGELILDSVVAEGTLVRLRFPPERLVIPAA